MADPLSNKEQALLTEIFKRHRPHRVDSDEIRHWDMVGNAIFEALKESYLAGRAKIGPEYPYTATCCGSVLESENDMCACDANDW